MNYDAVVVGLGNPGGRYAFTRHNVGFLLLDVLAQDFGQKFSTKGLGGKIQAEFCEMSLNSKKILFLKPQTFMNLSGRSLAALYQQANHLREKPLVVVHDEVDLPFGKIRAKLGGGDAGHNGLKSIRQEIGHGEYYRLRLGVGRPGGEKGVADHVLDNFSPAEEKTLLAMIGQGIKTLEKLVVGDLPAAHVEASREIKE